MRKSFRDVWSVIKAISETHQYEAKNKPCSVKLLLVVRYWLMKKYVGASLGQSVKDDNVEDYWNVIILSGKKTKCTFLVSHFSKP